MKTILSLFTALALVSFAGCAKDQTSAISTPAPLPEVSPTLEHPADPIVVNAERTLSAARDTFKFIAHEERQNQALFEKVSPNIHSFVENIRRNGVGWLRTAEAMKTAYKQNRTAENKANMLTAISIVSTSLAQSRQYLSLAGFKTTP